MRTQIQPFYTESNPATYLKCIDIAKWVDDVKRANTASVTVTRPAKESGYLAQDNGYEKKKLATHLERTPHQDYRMTLLKQVGARLSARSLRRYSI